VDAAQDADGLALDPEAMRALGYRTVDLLVDWLDASGPPLRRATPDEMRARIGGDPPERGEPAETLLTQLFEDVLPFTSRSGHPGFFAFVPFEGTWPGALGDFVASAANVYAGSWMESAGPTALELELVRWFCTWVGFPEAAAGTLVTGGSTANLTALACAREAVAGEMNDSLVLYVSDQAHSSIARGARLLGFRPEQMRVLPSEDDLRLDPHVLAAAIDRDRAAGRTPVAAVATAGATNSGSVDPLRALAAVCRERGVWLHVDAAYGGFAVLTDRGRATLDGIELADSLTLDPHKWLYQPYECGCLLVRDGAALRRTFEVVPDYLEESRADGAEVNLSDLGVQLTRGSRAFKLWLSLRHFGIGAFRDAIDRSLDLAAHARERIEASDVLELLAPPSLGVVCLRRRFDSAVDERNAGLAAALERSGIGLVSTTRLHGTFALRLCVLNHSSRVEDVEAVLRFLELAEPEEAPPERERHPSVTSSALLPEELALVGAVAEVRDVAAGETVVSRFESGREFFVVVEGSVAVELEGEQVGRLGPSEFFGELGAFDWGAGYGYARLASVVAAEPTRLLVVPDGGLPALLRAHPVLDRRVRAVARARFARR